MLIVQKFGGTSVADMDRIRNVAAKVKRELDSGNQVVAVVSAMAGVTNQLVGYVEDASNLASPAAWEEYDQVVSTGELVTSGLLALTLQEMGIKARSFSGWQIPVHTTGAHGQARIERIEPETLEAAIAEGVVPVVAGFQGIDEKGRKATLGRGGSDTSAVAIAGALKADRCDIYTDVDGVYTTDPRIVPDARKLEQISYEEMLEMASLGAKVLQTRSVAMAMNHGVKVQVLSSFKDEPGTLLIDEEELVEQQKVTGIAYSRDDARISITGVENVPGMSSILFLPLAEANVNVDMIVQNVTETGGATDITFTVPSADVERSIEIVEGLRGKLVFESVHTDKNVAKVSAIGVGMRSHSGVASQMFSALADKGINIIVITTSEIKVSILVEEEYVELAIRALHAAFELEGEAA